MWTIFEGVISGKPKSFKPVNKKNFKIYQEEFFDGQVVKKYKKIKENKY